MLSLIAVDPGDVHVGVAFFQTEDPDPWSGQGGGDWECVDTQEWTPNEFADGLAETMLVGEIDTIVFERFRLYADLAAEQTGSEFLTSQLIGVIKYLVRINNLHAQRHQEAEGKGAYLPCEMRGGMCAGSQGAKIRTINLVGQGADIKKPTAGVLKSKKMKSTAKRLKAGGHCFDAELHGWHYILNGEHTK